MHDIPNQPGASAASIVQMVGGFEHVRAPGHYPAAREIIGPWELGDECVKRRDSTGNAVGLVSYIMPYGDDDNPLTIADAKLKAAGCILFEDATPREQEVYVMKRGSARRNAVGRSAKS